MNVSSVGPFSNVACPSCGAHTRVKCEFGPYLLTRRHAVGGMSMVFVAQDNTLHREVAIKILSEEFSADERRIKSFEDEARITASFSHPHVVRVLTTGKAFGRFYIAMELVPGGHFEHQIRERGKIPEVEMLTLAIEVAEGLKAAHAAGLIHRDIKPGNILLDAENHAKIVDFGLALVTHGGKAQAAEIWATPYYVPPETIEGAPEDFRSDIYAFGATLYHALSGVPSCGEESMATNILREAKQRVIPLATLDPTLSVNTCKIVDRAMAYHPNDRFASYDEMIAELNSALKRLQSGTAASVETREAMAKRRARKKRDERLVIVAAAGVLLASVGTGIWWVKREQPSAPAPVAVVLDPFPTVSEPIAVGATEIAGTYREARAAIEAGEFEKAASEFSKLLENPDVQEPTRSWAGAEAVVASYLGGEGTTAVSRAKMAADHLRAVDSQHQLGTELLAVLDALPELPAIRAATISREKPNAPVVVSWLISGLKNWDQGMISEAGDFFTAVMKAEAAQDAEWLEIYQKIAGLYLADLETLSAPVFQNLPRDIAGCEAAISELDSVIEQLKTRGRARFNVRAWQLDLKRHAKLLASPQPASEVAPSAWDEDLVMGTLLEFAGTCEFAEAAAYLKALPAELPAATKESLLAVCESAGKFLTDLEGDLTQQAITGEFPLKSGAVATRVVADAVGGLTITDASGGVRNVGWGEFSSDSLIALHRSLMKHPASDEQRMVRHEHAISYDWIAGNRERAKLAAVQLVQTIPAFKARWEMISHGLPE
jgi:hypothetical protein